MKIDSITEVYPRKVYAVQTSTGTFISNGYAHHNCFHCNFKMPGCLAGNKIQYTKFMMKQGYTIEDLFNFDNLKFATKKMTINDFQEVENKYKDLNNRIGLRGGK